MTPACEASRGVSFLSQSAPGIRFIRRLNLVEKAICDYTRRIQLKNAELERVCPQPSPSSSSLSSSSSECPFGPPPSPELISKFEICEVVPIMETNLKLLEAEACVLLKELKALESITICSPSSSSSSLPPSSSSSSSPSDSSSSSSAPEPSSSSSSPSSSSSTEPSSSSSECCREFVNMYAECEALELNPPILLTNFTSSEYLTCGYGTSSSVSSSSSNPSSSSEEPSSSSSVEQGLDYKLIYNNILNRWEVHQNDVIIAVRESFNECDPYGDYPVTVGPCTGDVIFVG